MADRSQSGPAATDPKRTVTIGKNRPEADRSTGSTEPKTGAIRLV